MHWLKVVIKCILLILIIVILRETIILFQTSSLKMYLPQNKKNAIQTAKEYHTLSYEKGIKFSHIEAYRATDTSEIGCYYKVFFYLTDDSDCLFSMIVVFDMDSEQCTVMKDYYLIDVMSSRMKKEVDRDIKKVYGRRTKIQFLYNQDYIINEQTTLSDIKAKTQIDVVLKFEGKVLLNGNIKREAKKLFTCNRTIGEKGYKVLTLIYFKDMVSVSPFYQIIEVGEISSIEDAEKILSDFLDTDNSLTSKG